MSYTREGLGYGTRGRQWVQWELNRIRISSAEEGSAEPRSHKTGCLLLLADPKAQGQKWGSVVEQTYIIRRVQGERDHWSLFF